MLKEIKFHRNCLTKRLDKQWEWQSAIWFKDTTFFADCRISGAFAFPTKRKCVADMKKVLAQFGVKA